MDAIRRAASRLADLGFTLVKLKPNTKQPVDGFGRQQRTTTEKCEISRWRGEHNLGILAGTMLPNDQRLLIVDIDDKNGKTGSKFLPFDDRHLARHQRRAAYETPATSKDSCHASVL